MATSSQEKSRNPDIPKTRLEECFHEFQEKVHRKKPEHIPAPPLPPDSKYQQKDLEYDILTEIQKIHRIIQENGYQGDFGMEIKFGQLIPIYGADQVDRLVEVLANARKNGYVNYKLNEFLQPDRHDDIAIRSIKTPF